ncbi:MAG: DUF2075 domain-containing protein [Clostridia bacterium]|nr:DUF2075 domain-containing protein [Clostridia bacterium]
MPKAYYDNSISGFLNTSDETILGRLLISDEFRTTTEQKNAWRDEICILKKQLSSVPDGSIVFEYTIPRIGDRIDVVCLIRGIVFVLEFKVNQEEYLPYDEEQVVDYCLDLKYFHEESEHRHIVPILVATKAPHFGTTVTIFDDKVVDTILCNETNIAEKINAVLRVIPSDDEITANAWINSKYRPTPTIIEAAQALYQKHDVKEISRNDAGAENLEKTNAAINYVIEDCKTNHKKAICFITGVPGAGKTLAGLNIANTRHQFEENDHAVFLSGNGPLVQVLQEALARDDSKRNSISKSKAKTKTKAFIQIVHRFRDAAVLSDDAPIEKVAIFDEAQRAWDMEQLTKFMAQKKGVPDFNKSEPESLIEFMNRHDDWATIVCLVGGGQEINTGEGGIVDWFDALRDNFSEWEIYLSDKMTDSEYVGDSSIDDLLGRDYHVIPELHLSVSMRSFRSEKQSAFVKALLDCNVGEAAFLYNELKDKYPIVLTRDLTVAKQWVRSKSRGSERYGMMATSAAERLRARGIWASNEIKPEKWFLEGKDNVDSSYHLEITATEFDIQGLEIDYGIVAWDGDVRYFDGEFTYRRFTRNMWCNVNKEERRRYMKNAYRVLLTRSRQGMVIYVPEGNAEDVTTAPELYDSTYEYLKSVGIEEI